MSAELPEGWVEAALGDMGDWTSGGTPSRKDPRYYKGTIPWVKTGDLRDGPVVGELEKITEEAVANSSAKLLPASTILIAMYGATIGRLGVLQHEATCNQACAALLPQTANLESLPFIYHYLRSSRERFRSEGKGGAQPNISQGMIKEFDIPLPPLNEQKRIVAKIDALTEKSREARAALDDVPALLDQLRQSILAAAFRGDLTKKWREQNTDVEPASVLLDRIRTERHRKWEEAELAKFQAKGKVPKGDEWKSKYKEPEPVDTEGLPELPEGWCWAVAEELAWDITVGFVGPMKHRYVEADGVPFLRSQNVRRNRFDPKGLLQIDPAFHEELSKSKLSPGDLVVVRSGAPGTACVVPPELPEANCADLVVVRPLLGVNSHYWGMYCNSPLSLAHVGLEQVGVAQQHFNVGSAKRMPIPLCPESEQTELVRLLSEVETTTTTKGALATELAKELDGLDSSILAKAFRGELVLQDPNDEPASVLLERIRAEREKAGAAKKKRGRKSR